MTSNRLENIFIACNNCGNDNVLKQEVLTAQLRGFDHLTLSNLATLISRFICSKCRSRSQRISDANGDLLFDANQIVHCKRCKLPIPFPRIKILPGVNICTLCKEEDEDDEPLELGPQFPAVPKGFRGRCPVCEKKGSSGIVVVYQNSKNKSFFLGCSSYPNCKWSKLVDFD